MPNQGDTEQRRAKMKVKTIPLSEITDAIRDVRMRLYDYDAESRRERARLEERIAALEEAEKRRLTVTVDCDAFAKLDPAAGTRDSCGLEPDGRKPYAMRNFWQGRNGEIELPAGIEIAIRYTAVADRFWVMLNGVSIMYHSTRCGAEDHAERVCCAINMMRNPSKEANDV